MSPAATRTHEDLGTMAKANRTYWDRDRWLSYGKRLHRVVWLVDEAGSHLDGAKDHHAPDVDARLRVRNAAELAMVKLERVVEEHFGGYQNAPAPLNGFVQHWFEEPERARVERDPFTRRFVLTRDEWALIGQKLKAASDILDGLHAEFHNECRGKDRGPHGTALQRCIRAMGPLQSRLGSVARKQHPDWSDVGHVFYGPDAP